MRAWILLGLALLLATSCIEYEAGWRTVDDEGNVTFQIRRESAPEQATLTIERGLCLTYEAYKEEGEVMFQGPVLFLGEDSFGEVGEGAVIRVGDDGVTVDGELRGPLPAWVERHE